MMRLSRVAAVVGGVVGIAVIPAPVVATAAAPPAGCHWALPTALALPAGFTSAGVAATDGETGFAGTATNFSSDFYDCRALVWQGGQGSLLPIPDGYFSEATGMNRLGDVVGFVGPATGGTVKPALWRAGTLVQLATANPDTSASAHDINDAGLIVGEAQEVGGYFQAVAWSANAPDTFRYVPGGSSQPTFLNSVTEDGVLAGNGTVETSTGVFQNQAVTGTVDAGLHPVPEPVPGAIANVYGAAGSYLVGDYYVGDELASHAVIWRNEQPQVLSTGNTTARGVNSQGVAVGIDSAAGKPVVWMNGVEQ